MRERYAIKSIFLLLNFAIVLASLAASSDKEESKEILQSGKFNPGHYAAVGPGETAELDDIKYLDDPAIIGINKRYFWKTLEGDMGGYDLSLIKNDLEYLAAKGKQLVVFLIDKKFSANSPLPKYLSEYEYLTDSGSYDPARWDDFYIDRILALAGAIGEAFGTNPNFEGLAVQESSLEITEAAYNKFEYTPEKYRDALIRILTGIKAAMPESNVFWYSNFLPDNDDYLYDIADAIIPCGVFMGGPDILPYRRYLGMVSYPMYDDYKDKLVLFCSAQGDSYKHHKNDIRAGSELPPEEDGYLTMDEIFLFGRDKLHLSYIFWDYEYEGEELGYNTFDDAIRTIRKYPVFNSGTAPRKQ